MKKILLDAAVENRSIKAISAENIKVSFLFLFITTLLCLSGHYCPYRYNYSTTIPVKATINLIYTTKKLARKKAKDEILDELIKEYANF